MTINVIYAFQLRADHTLLSGFYIFKTVPKSSWFWCCFPSISPSHEAKTWIEHDPLVSMAGQSIPWSYKDPNCFMLSVYILWQHVTVTQSQILMCWTWDWPEICVFFHPFASKKIIIKYLISMSQCRLRYHISSFYLPMTTDQHILAVTSAQKHLQHQFHKLLCWFMSSTHSIKFIKAYKDVFKLARSQLLVPTNTWLDASVIFTINMHNSDK